MRNNALLIFGVVTLAFFGLIAYIVHALRTTNHRIARVIVAVATLAATLPAILYALRGWQP